MGEPNSSESWAEIFAGHEFMERVPILRGMVVQWWEIGRIDIAAHLQCPYMQLHQHGDSERDSAMKTVKNMTFELGLANTD